jgi:hypothetical protein
MIINLHVQFNSHQNPNDVNQRDSKINSKIHSETQKTMSKKNNTGDITIPDLTIY